MSKVENLKMIVAIERFKTDLAILGLDEVEIQGALEEVVHLATDSNMDLFVALRYIKDLKTFLRNHHGPEESAL